MFQWLRKGMSEFTDWYRREGFFKLDRLNGASSTWSGEHVSEGNALNNSVVWACKRIISESTAFLPLSMMRENSDGERSPVRTHPSYGAWKYAPNDETTAMTFRETLTGHCVMQGNCYAKIERRGGTGEAIEYWLLMPEQVTPDRAKQSKRLVYLVKEGNSAEKTYEVQRGKAQDILHVPGLSHDGMRGYSVLEVARQSFATAIATERNVGRFHANGARVPYVLMMKNKFKNDTDYAKFRTDWEKVYSEPHRAPILENDTEYKQTGLSMADAQMLESRQFSIPEICRWFGISPHMVGDLSRATFSNIEELGLYFVTYTLTGWLRRWEQNLWRCVLTPEEKNQGYFFKHNTNALMRGNFISRMQGYATALQNGWLSQNEVRALEDLNSFEGGDDMHIQLNMQTLGDGAPTASQAASLVKIGSAQKGFRKGQFRER